MKHQKISDRGFIIRFLSLFFFVFMSSNIYSQNVYEELENPVQTDLEKWKSMQKEISVMWGNTDTRYKKEEPYFSVMSNDDLTIRAWRGERVSAQIVVSTKVVAKDLSVEISSDSHLKNKDGIITITKGFVRYVMTDELNKNGSGGCGVRNKSDFDSTLVADPIDITIDKIDVKPNTTQAVWLSINVPQGAKAKRHTYSVNVKANDKIVRTLTLNVDVLRHKLPAPKDWSFYLDLWQNPYAVSRYYDVKPFSDKHLELMKPIIAHYANAGGKAITASIIYKPWNGQTYDAFDTMIECIRTKDNTWRYDYSVFDKWVEFMISQGVDKQINCYSMIPWKLSFRYFDEQSNSYKYINKRPGTDEYNDFWYNMLLSFSQHLKQKGWFSITHIGIDERPMRDVEAAFEIIKKADKDFKISYAGNYHENMSSKIEDYCIAFTQKFTPEDLKARKEKRLNSTVYTCCTEAKPNTFTFSNPSEAEWIGWYIAKEGFDGYLRWALNSWVEKPFHDSRFVTWAAGDTYLLYPHGISSIRFERLREGIQAFEKIKVLRKNKKNIPTIDNILNKFDDLKVNFTDITTDVNRAKEELNSL